MLILANYYNRAVIYVKGDKIWITGIVQTAEDSVKMTVISAHTVAADSALHILCRAVHAERIYR
jgi:hypothetical protein